MKKRRLNTSTADAPEPQSPAPSVAKDHFDRLKFLEFFAGGGMARLGLGAGWECVFANDIDESKGQTYRENFEDSHELRVADIAGLTSSDLPGHADLAWASFPCQDLSLAGSGGGLKGERSGTFWPFWGLMTQLGEEGRAPRVVVLENVYGTLTSHGGRDFTTICKALGKGGYRYGAMVIDAVHFVPQSRPRVFIVALKNDVVPPAELVTAGPDGVWHVAGLVEAYEKLPRTEQKEWVWWNVPAPEPRRVVFSDLIEDMPSGVEWHTPAQTRHILRLMSPINRAKVDAAKKLDRRVVGAVYRRTRPGASGTPVQRAEVRFDQVAGCLRTPRGGSSRQTILVIEGKEIRSRLLSPREAARLMGLPDSYVLPTNYNAAYHVAGDGVVVPVVAHLNRELLQPLAAAPHTSMESDGTQASVGSAA